MQIDIQRITIQRQITSKSKLPNAGVVPKLRPASDILCDVDDVIARVKMRKPDPSHKYTLTHFVAELFGDNVSNCVCKWKNNKRNKWEIVHYYFHKPKKKQYYSETGEKITNLRSTEYLAPHTSTSPTCTFKTCRYRTVFGANNKWHRLFTLDEKWSERKIHTACDTDTQEKPNEKETMVEHLCIQIRVCVCFCSSVVKCDDTIACNKTNGTRRKHTTHTPRTWRRRWRRRIEIRQWICTDCSNDLR